MIIVACASIAQAQDLFTVNLSMRDGKFLPSSIIHVPANQGIRLLVNNQGTSAAEFESIALRKEKVLGPDAQSFLVIAPLKPGKYDFFDDFHPGTKGVLIAE